MENTLDEHLLGNFSEDDFKLYKRFFRQEDALSYAELLKENDIPYRLGGSDVLITEAIVGTPSYPKITLKVLSSDFKQVNQLIEEEILKSGVDLEEHYLNEYTDHQLLDILKKPDESSIEDIIITKQLLKSRGIPIDESALENMKMDRLVELQKGKSVNNSVIIGYLVAIIAGAFLFSPLILIAAIGMGLYYWKDTSVDIDGNTYSTFDPPTQNFGKFLLIFTIVVILVILLSGIPLYLDISFR